MRRGAIRPVNLELATGFARTNLAAEEPTVSELDFEILRTADRVDMVSVDLDRVRGHCLEIQLATLEFLEFSKHPVVAIKTNFASGCDRADER